MFKLEREKTGAAPYIYVDEEKGYMRFFGESFHENVLEVYSDIIKWLSQYVKTDFESFTFDCELKYFNSSTAKMLFNILLLLDEASKNGRQVTVNWITTADNEINIECGEDFADEAASLDFNIIIQPASA